jgi:hypothetical protein
MCHHRVPSGAGQVTGVPRSEESNVLFHIKQSHAPADCPYGKGGSKSLFDQSGEVKILGYWLAFPQHTTYLVVETDDIGKLQNFLKPGAGITSSEITPVSDQPVP